MKPPMHWFGTHMFGPICETNPRAAIPIGEICPECGDAIGERDDGVLFVTEDRPLVYHLACFLMLTLGRSMQNE